MLSGTATVEDELPEPGACLDSLRTIVDRFVQLDRFPRRVAEARYHEVLALVHAVCAGVLACERAGLERPQIVEVLAPVREIHARSPFVRRLQEWPRNYPGDFETVDYICSGENRAAPGTVEYECERYALSAPIAQQHRNKVAHQAARMLETMLAKRGASRIASIACGSAPDLRRLLPQLADVAGEIYLNDLDADALAAARAHLEPVADRCHFVHTNAMKVPSRLRDAGPFDLVLAGGLFDYLDERHAIALIRSIRTRLLAAGGAFFFTNIATGNPYRVLVEYLGDWFLKERSEADIIRYCTAAGFAPEHVRITRDETGLALLIEART